MSGYDDQTEGRNIKIFSQHTETAKCTKEKRGAIAATVYLEAGVLRLFVSSLVFLESIEASDVSPFDDPAPAATVAAPPVCAFSPPANEISSSSCAWRGSTFERNVPIRFG